MTAIIKLLFDLCFYYTLSGYFMHLVAGGYPLIWGIPLIIASNAVYWLLKKFRPGAGIHTFRYVRLPAFICSAAPAVILLFSPTPWQIAQYLPAWAYSCFIIWSERTAVTYREFEDHFTFTGKLHLLLIFGVIFISRIPGALTGIIPYFTLYILSGVYLMRFLREEGKLSAGRNAAALLALLLSAVVITVFRAPQLFMTVVGFLYKNVIVWVLTGLAVIIAAVGYAVYYLFAAFFSLFSGKSVQIDLNPGGIVQDILGEEIAPTQSASPVWLKAVLLAFLAAVIALAVFLIFRRLLGSKPSARSESAYTVEQEKLDKSTNIKPGGWFRPKEPRLAVRWYYRKYLKEGISRGARLSPSDTSKSVKLKYERFFPGNASDRLREVYIKARYAMFCPVQSHEVSEVHELWKILRGERSMSKAEAAGVTEDEILNQG
jgi:hypothetical protein